MLLAATLQAILDEGIVAILRYDRATDVLPVADALCAGGLRTLEVTLGTPGVFGHIETLAARGGLRVGVGSVVSVAAVDAAVGAGAQFVVTPLSRRDVIARAHHHGVPVFSGAMTPGEMQTAYEWGADVVKMFPAQQLGPAYLRAVRGPLPHLRLMPTGGVTAENAAAWLQAGACALGVGGALTDPRAVAEGGLELLTARARALVAAVATARANLPTAC